MSLSEKTKLALNKMGYTLNKEIGRGAVGVVFKGTLNPQKRTKAERSKAKRSASGIKTIMSSSSIKANKNAITVAIKMMVLSQMSPLMRDRYLVDELTALTRVRHKNIVRVYDIVRMHDALFIMMEFAPNGDMHKYIFKNGKLSEQTSQKWFGQVALAISYLHCDLRIAHRDIKCDNVLLDENMNARVADFGFAKRSWDNKHKAPVVADTKCGTRVYFCPQLVEHSPYNPYLADVWAMGVMLYIMTHAMFAFQFEEKNALAQQRDYPRYIQSILDKKLSSPIRKLIIHMLDPSEKTRYTIKQVLACEWLAKSANKH